MDGEPLRLFGFERAAAILGEFVIAALAAIILLAPFGGDEALAFEAAQNGIEHAVGPIDLVGGKFADAAGEGVTVAFALGEDGKDEGPSGSGYEVFREHGGHLYVEVLRMSSVREKNVLRS